MYFFSIFRYVIGSKVVGGTQGPSLGVYFFDPMGHFDNFLQWYVARQTNLNKSSNKFGTPFLAFLHRCKGLLPQNWCRRSFLHFALVLVTFTLQMIFDGGRFRIDQMTAELTENQAIVFVKYSRVVLYARWNCNFPGNLRHFSKRDDRNILTLVGKE